MVFGVAQEKHASFFFFTLLSLDIIFNTDLINWLLLWPIFEPCGVCQFKDFEHWRVISRGQMSLWTQLPCTTSCCQGSSEKQEITKRLLLSAHWSPVCAAVLVWFVQIKLRLLFYIFSLTDLTPVCGQRFT